MTAVLNAKPVPVSHDAPHMDAFSVKDIVNIESFLFDTLPLKSMMADVLSTPCFVPSFGKDAQNFEYPFDRDILHAKCSPAL